MSALGQKRTYPHRDGAAELVRVLVDEIQAA